MAKSALATGALALGAGGFGTATVGAQQDRVAVFANNFFPGTEFTVVAPLQTSSTVAVLQLDGESIPEVSQPDEWGGHVIRYDIGDVDEAGVTTFLFVRGQRLSSGETGMIGREASVLSSDLNLLTTTLASAQSDSGSVEEDTTEDGPVEADPVQEDSEGESENETADEHGGEE